MHALFLRELLSAARSPASYWIRSFAAASLLFAVFLAQSNPALAAIPGRGFFRGLQLITLALVWILTPLLVCDSISREKREGTLPLLFLTRLSAGEVIVAKASLHCIRAASMLAACFPVLMIPVLSGGVSLLDAARMFVIQIAALLLAVGGGLITSSIATHWLATRLLAASGALASSLSFLLAYKFLHAAWYYHQLAPNFKAQFPFKRILAIEWQSLRWQIPPSPGFWSTGAYSNSRFSDLVVALLFLCCATIAFAAAAYVATRLLEKTWTNPPPTPAQLSLLAKLRTFPLLKPVPLPHAADSHDSLARALLWQQSSPLASRLARVGWCALAWTLAATGFLHDKAGFSFIFAYALGLGMVAASAGSFRKEIESGALELLLVSPISPADIIRARWFGLLQQFAPAFVGGALISLLRISSGFTGSAASDPLLYCGIAALFLVSAALVGTALSIARLAYAGAFVLAFLLSIALPGALLLIASDIGGFVIGAVLASAAQGINLWLAWRFATSQLATRKYLDRIRPDPAPNLQAGAPPQTPPQPAAEHPA